MDKIVEEYIKMDESNIINFMEKYFKQRNNLIWLWINRLLFLYNDK